MRDEERASASSARATSDDRGTAQWRPPVDLLELSSRIPAVDPAQAEHADAISGVTGPAHGDLQTTYPGLDLIRRAAEQKLLDLDRFIIPRDPDDHRIRIIGGKTIWLTVRG